MAWNEPGKRDPWRGNQKGPDIEDVLRRVRERFGALFGGGSGGGGNTGSIGVLIAVIAILARVSEREAMGFHPRAFLWVLGPVILFGAMLMQGGLVLSAFVAVLLSSFASRQFRWRGALLNAVVLAIIVLGAFAYALRIQIPVWPAMIVEGMR